MSKDFKDYLKEKFANVDRAEIAKEYKKEFEPRDLLKSFQSAMNTMNMKTWVQSDKCDWDKQRKTEYVLSYVNARKKAKLIQKYLKQAKISSFAFKEWQDKNDPQNIEDDLLLQLEEEGIGKKKVQKVKHIEDSETDSLKIKIPKKTKVAVKTDKKEESKPKTEN